MSEHRIYEEKHNIDTAKPIIGIAFLRGANL